ncbi:MAG: hypothetical protein ACRD1N_09470 [Terriglobia bacterium]
MGVNKDIRKKIDGLKRDRRKHLLKLDREIRKEVPDQGLIKKWRSEIAQRGAGIGLLEHRLKRRRNYAARKG